MRILVLLAVAVVMISGCADSERRAAARQANPAPCPNAFVLQDAARFIEFSDGESLDAVTLSGEFDGVSTRCRYYADLPIEAEVDLAFSIGRPAADTAETRTVRYFVAVTRTNRDVIAKQVFEAPVKFQRGQRIAQVQHSIDRIVIPRAGEETSGVNFEIAVGFVLDREQVLFNRSGKSLKFPEAT